MYHDERRLAIDMAREAGELAAAVQRELVAASATITKDDRSPVTVADLAIQALISERLAEHFPGDPLLAEESSDVLAARPDLVDQIIGIAGGRLPGLDRPRLLAAIDRGSRQREPSARWWVLDPIDGTKGFLRGDQYAVALALVDAGRVVTAVLACPNLPAIGGAPGRGGLFSAELGGGAHGHDLATGEQTEIAVDEVRDPALAVVCESVEAAHAAHSEQAQIARRLGISTPPVRIDSQCKYAVVARGEASIYLRLPPSASYREKVWDHAAGSLIIEEAGGRVSDLLGRPLDFSGGRHLARQRGIVATNGRLHEQVLAACREVLGPI